MAEARSDLTSGIYKQHIDALSAKQSRAGRKTLALKILAEMPSLTFAFVLAVISTIIHYDDFFEIVLACKNKLAINEFYTLLVSFRFSENDKEKVEKERSQINIADDEIIFSDAFRAKHSSKNDELALTIQSFTKDFEALKNVTEIFNRTYRVEFLKLFNPDYILQQVIDGPYKWDDLRSLTRNSQTDETAQASISELARYIGLRHIDLPLGAPYYDYKNQVVFLHRLKNLASACSDITHPDHLRTAGQRVYAAFDQAYKSGSLSTPTEELDQLTGIAEQVTTVITSSDHDFSPLIQKLTDQPLHIGDQRTRRIVFGALAAFVCAALVAASITLALVSFGVLAPLTIATITLSTNLLVAGLATAAAPVAAGLASGATLYAISGRKQGPVLAVEQFVKQQPAPTIT